MRIFFIVDETLFFLPQWLDKIIGSLNKDYQVVGITPLVTRGKPTFYNYIYRNILAIGPFSIIKLLMVSLSIIFKKTLFFLRISSAPMSIRQVADKYKTKVITTNNVNSAIYIDQIKKLEPDLIISSCSQIFRKDILSLPKIGCINRHSGLLPSYAGVFPVFYAMINREKYIGVTIHHMLQSIDAGAIIYQEKIQISKKDTLFSLYEKAYDASVDAILASLGVISGHKKPYVIRGVMPSYYSFPKRDDWNKFRKLGLKFI